MKLKEAYNIVCTHHGLRVFAAIYIINDPGREEIWSEYYGPSIGIHEAMSLAEMKLLRISNPTLSKISKIFDREGKCIQAHLKPTG